MFHNCSWWINFDVETTTFVWWRVIIACITDIWFWPSSVHWVSHRDISIIILFAMYLLGFDFEDLGGIFTVRICMSSAAVRSRLCTLYTVSVLLGRIHVMMMRLLFWLDLWQIGNSSLRVFFIFEHILIVIIILLMRTIILRHWHAKVAFKSLAFCGLCMRSGDLIIVSRRSIYCVDYLRQQSTHLFIANYSRHSLGCRSSTMIPWININYLGGTRSRAVWLIWDSLELYCVIGRGRQLKLE